MKFLLHRIIQWIWQKIFLALKEVFSQKFISVIVFLAIIVAVVSVGLFQIVGTNFNSYINDQFALSIPPNMIKVTPKTVPSFGFITLRKPPGSVLNDAYMEKIVFLEGVKKIHPYMALQIPMQVIINIFGLRYRSDIACIGAPYNMVWPEIASTEYRTLWKKWETGRTLPVLIPSTLLDSYNKAMAEPSGLPKINPQLIMGTQAELLFGKSSLKEIPGYEVETAKLVGFTKNITTLALVVPLNVARYYNAKFKGGDSDKEYMYTFIEVDDHESLFSVSKEIRSWGFIVETEKSVSQEIIGLKETVNTAISSLTIVIIFLSVIAIAFSTIIATLNRVEYYRILRILGGSKLFISLTIFLKYAILGYLGAKLGLFFIEYFFNNNISIIQFAGFEISLSINEELAKQAIIFGMIIPALSTIPALAQLYIKGLNRD